MSDFTNDEIQAAVGKLIRSTVRSPTGSLGERRIEVSFSDLQEAAAGVFILYFNAPFYVLLLGSRRVADIVQQQGAVLTQLLDAVAATDRLVLPIKDISSLANARGALAELEAAVSGRDEPFRDIEQVPAFRRYASNVAQFIDREGRQIKSGATIVDTPASARAQIPGLVRSLRSLRDELVRRTTLLVNALADFSSLNLSKLAAQGVITSSRKVLDQRLDELASKTPEERLESLREVTLDLLTQRTLVGRFGAAQPPSTFITTTGTGAAFSDASHLATAASVASTVVGGAQAILSGNNFLQIAVDSGAPIEYPLPLSFVAQLVASTPEPYLIEPDSDQLVIGFGPPDSQTIFTVNLTNGALVSSQQVAADIATAAAGAGVVDLAVERAFSPTKFDSKVTITSLGGGNIRLTLIAGTIDGLNLQAGDEVEALDGIYAGNVWTITSVDVVSGFFDATGPHTIDPAPVAARVQAGPANRVLVLRDAQPAASLAQRRAITIVSGTTEHANSAARLGFFAGSSVRSRPTLPKEVVDSITSSTSAFTAALEFLPVSYAGRARSSLTNPSVMVLSKLELLGTWPSGSIVPVDFTALEGDPGQVVPGDSVVIRSSSFASDAGRTGVVVSLVGTLLTVSFGTDVGAGTGQLEVGPPPSLVFGDTIHVLEGLNQGRYTLSEPMGVGVSAPFEVLLDRVLPFAREGNTVLEFQVSTGRDTIRFGSPSQQVSSTITVSNPPVAGGSGAELWFDPSELPATAVGSTQWLQLSNFPKGVSIGDLVLLFETSFGTADRTFSVVSLESDNRLLQLTPEIESSAALNFEPDQPLPFARIRVGQVANYAEFSARLAAWIKRPEQQESFFRDLSRFLNPVLVNRNPTAAQVNDASNHLRRMLALLTLDGARNWGAVVVPSIAEEDTIEFALANYSAPASEPIDTLLRTFREKGADRAIDLLLEGQFSTFFGLDIEEVSYSGKLQKALREVAREDLPVRKHRRTIGFEEKLIGTSGPEPDYEFDISDADAPGIPDIPIGSDLP